MLLLQVLTDGLIIGSTFAIGALGFNLIYGTTQTFHIAYGATLLVAVYLAAGIGTSGGALTVGLLVGLVAATLIGVATYLGFYRQMEARGRSRVVVFVASLGLAIAAEAAILLIFDAQPRRFELGGLLDARNVAGQDISPLGIITVAVALALLVGLAKLLRSTSFGRQVQSVAMNPELAETIGIRTRRVTVAVYAIGSALGFIALVILSTNSAVTSDIGTSFTLVVAVAVIAGGLGSLLGSYLLAIFFGLLQSIAGVYLSGQWTLVLIYGAFLVLIMARPTGLFPGFAKA